MHHDRCFSVRLFEFSHLHSCAVNLHSYAVTVNQEAQSAKEMLLMATSADEQKMWVQQLSKKVSRKGLTFGAGGDRPAPGYVQDCSFSRC